MFTICVSPARLLLLILNIPNDDAVCLVPVCLYISWIFATDFIFTDKELCIPKDCEHELTNSLKKRRAQARKNNWPHDGWMNVVEGDVLVGGKMPLECDVEKTIGQLSVLIVL